MLTSHLCYRYKSVLGYLILNLNTAAKCRYMLTAAIISYLIINDSRCIMYKGANLHLLQLGFSIIT